MSDAHTTTSAIPERLRDMLLVISDVQTYGSFTHLLTTLTEPRLSPARHGGCPQLVVVASHRRVLCHRRAGAQLTSVDRQTGELSICMQLPQPSRPPRLNTLTAAAAAAARC